MCLFWYKKKQMKSESTLFLVLIRGFILKLTQSLEGDDMKIIITYICTIGECIQNIDCNS